MLKHIAVTAPQKRYWKIILTAICLLGFIVAWLGFGEQGLFNLYRKEKDRQALIKRIDALNEENRDLLNEIERLKTDMGYVESVIRKELNMVRENEVIFRFRNKAGDTGGGIGTKGARSGHRDEKSRIKGD